MIIMTTTYKDIENSKTILRKESGDGYDFGR